MLVIWQCGESPLVTREGTFDWGKLMGMVLILLMLINGCFHFNWD